MKRLLFSLLTTLILTQAYSQVYFYKEYAPFNPEIPTPEEFLDYPVGEYHTRHDRMVAYFEKLASVSDKATLIDYGKTHEKRRLVMLMISTEGQLAKLDELQKNHLANLKGEANTDAMSRPVFINLGYNVHGNEPSGGEAALLSAYTLVASQSDAVKKYLENSVIFIDPTINPDGRDRHTQWANSFRGNPKVKDPADMEHNEGWPRGRTNHYWFDLNRDWLLGIHPESRGKLTWYHQWYPNVVTDFHEMGTNGTYFFEPMKDNASKNPIMPKENYTTLNDLFANYYVEELDKIGSFYFTKEVFDGTYPGYGSSYPDLQGGLGILFEQASSRGHVQETLMGDVTFPFTIRNQYLSSMATVKAAVENKATLFKYQSDFFKSALDNSRKSSVKAYVFGECEDRNRTLAFVDKLLLHKIKVHKLKSDVNKGGDVFCKELSFIVPTNQPQYRMVQTMFETYDEYVDSVFYDASAWSLANFYNMPYQALTGSVSYGEEVNSLEDLVIKEPFEKSDYAYLIKWEDYNVHALLYDLQSSGVRTLTGMKPFSMNLNGMREDFGYGTLLIPVSKQAISKDSLESILSTASTHHKVKVHAVNSGYSITGIDLGSGSFRPNVMPKAAMLVEGGVSSYEAGEVWHLLDTRVDMPITKVPMRNFGRLNLDKYNTLVMVSGNYGMLDSADREKIKSWVSKGNTLITSRQASSWAIQNKLVNEKLIKEEKNKEEKSSRKPYVDARENIGKDRIGGAIFEVELDLTHPLAFGYTDNKLPVYRNSTVFIAPSKNSYATVAAYTADPHIDGFVTEKNLNKKLKGSASLIVSKIGRGRVVMFADNPNFRGSWYGTNKLFLNALFLGNHVSVPNE